ncbi:MAG: hypothetical protein QOF48_3110 [Verrucomicrobiota bacterium]|jgi:tetratricopeptide (TPR) repeat protein
MLMLAMVAGCVAPRETPAQREAKARALFDSTTKNYHLPSADARGAERDRLLAAAARGYEQLLREYPGHSHLCATALCSLGNVRISQSRLDDAVKLYSDVAKKYPDEDWEVLTAWKSAGDALADAGRVSESQLFFEKIILRFDKPGSPAVVKTIVRGATARLAASRAPGPQR